MHWNIEWISNKWTPKESIKWQSTKFLPLVAVLKVAAHMWPRGVIPPQFFPKSTITSLVLVCRDYGGLKTQHSGAPALRMIYMVLQQPFDERFSHLVLWVSCLKELELSSKSWWTAQYAENHRDTLENAKSLSGLKLWTGKQKSLTMEY